MEIYKIRFSDSFFIFFVILLCIIIYYNVLNFNLLVSSESVLVFSYVVRCS